MKKYIIATLCLVAVWGCSDDSGTNTDDDRFPLIEGMAYIDETGRVREIMGDENKVETLCQKGDEYDLNAYPNTTEREIAIDILADENLEVSIYLETARVSQELLDEITKEYKGRVPQHDTYSEFKLIDRSLNAGLNSVFITVREVTPGPYLLKIIPENGEERCVSILVATPLESE